MAPPITSPGTGGGSPSRPPLAGAAEASAPSSSSTASTGEASSGISESSSTPAGTALSPTLGAAPRSAADAPEAAPGVSSAESQPQSSVSGSGASGDDTCAAADGPEVSSAIAGAFRFSYVRWDDIEDIVTAGAGRTAQQVQGSTQSHFLAGARLVVDLNRRPPLRTDYELDQRLEAAGSLSEVVEALAPIPCSPAPWEDELSELRDDVASLEARERQSSACGGAGSTMPAAFVTFLEELGALQLATQPLPAASGPSGVSAQAAPASSASSGDAADVSGSSTALTVDSSSSDDSGPVIPSTLHKSKGKRSCGSVGSVGRCQARQTYSEDSFAASDLTCLGVITTGLWDRGLGGQRRAFVRVSPQRLQFAVSPIPRAPTSPAPSTAPTTSLPSTPVTPSGVTPGTEASVLVEIDDDGGAVADGAATETSDAIGGGFSTPVVS
ncbi:unnamed protein product [Phytophthora fragariaefolia]|uniref:Unnamed protein product n=1 Tax=Phytophthora fragariaefolia TaxID=1490495 RepID=A0A9W6TM22_9STRA|nr:unnamed protein product [Phytophthora fragariaefolia]